MMLLHRSFNNNLFVQSRKGNFMYIARRKFLKGFSIAGIAIVAPLRLFTDEVPSCPRANGAGSYQIGPYQSTEAAGEDVYLTADMGFDETMAFCKISTNYAPLRFATMSMGSIDLGAHEFFMEMQSTTISNFTLEDTPDGPKFTMSGTMRSETRVLSGSRMQTYIEENIAFGCEAGSTTLSPSIQISARNFFMSPRFDPQGDHAAIFGDEPHFGGTLTKGNIIIVP
jgi:hypothetical protein